MHVRIKIINFDAGSLVVTRKSNSSVLRLGVNGN